MIGFEWEFFHRESSDERKSETSFGWYRRQPRWLKFVFALVALPAWSVIAFNSLTGVPNSTSSWVAFCLFASVAVAVIVSEHRRKKGGANG